MEVKISSRSQGVSRVTEGRDHCVIDPYSSAQRKFELEDYRYDIRAACGPQYVFVRLSFEKADDSSNIRMSVRVLPGDEVGDNSFDWQAWRDSFYGRLEGTRKRQEELSSPSHPLLSTAGSISCGIEKIQVRTAGTGAIMNVWKGWVSPRASICLYEITTPEFVMQSESAGSVTIRVEKIECVLEAFDVPREKWHSVKYKKASPLALKHASIVAHHLLKNVADGVDSPAEEHQDALTRAVTQMADAKNGESTTDLVLLLLERAALCRRDTVTSSKL